MNGFTAFCISCLLSYAAMAPSVAQAGKREDLRRAEAELERSKQEQEELAVKTGDAEDSLTDTKRKLVKVTKALRKKETEAVVTERKLQDLTQQITQKNETLAAEKTRLQAMVDASVRLSRMQPEALVMMPEIGEQTVTAARAMRIMAGSMQTLSQQLAADLKQLEALKKAAQQRRDELEKLTAELRHERDAMKALTKERAELYARTNEEYKAAARRVKNLASEAQDLKALVAALEKELQEKPKREQKKTGGKTISPSMAKVNAQRGKLRSFASAKGDIRAPAAGTLQKTYGSGGSKGITILTTSGASVMAPYDGEVVYTGNFMNYGRMVILKHADNFHSLVAGLSNISISTGEFLLEGEPIGAMGSEENHRKLYVELRKDNHPVNPASWIAGL